LTSALELLQILPDTPERTQQELTLQLSLGVPLLITKGHAAPEVGTAYTRARELCRQVGATPQLFPVVRGLWFFNLLRAELRTARELGEQLLSLAQSVQDPLLLSEGHRAMGVTLFWLGEGISAREHFEQGIVLYEPRQHRSHAFLYEQDPGTTHRIYAACALWYLGYPDQALERIHDALTLARELAHPFSLVFTLTFAAICHQFRRERHLTQEQAEAVMTLSTAQGFVQYLAQGAILRGWAVAEQGQGEEGIAQMRQGLVAFRATGAKLLAPYYLALLAEAYEKMGQAEEGLSVLAEALEAVHRTEKRMYEAELYRLKGELTLQQGSVQGLESRGKEAEECFHKAIEIARQQQAKSLELRAVMSLARLWQQGKQKEAHELLSEIYGWFTEGFDTKDLQEAKVLLEELT
jgi:predicted ATPase